jgi:hypothetical protein
MMASNDAAACVAKDATTGSTAPHLHLLASRHDRRRTAGQAKPPY